MHKLPCLCDMVIFLDYDTMVTCRDLPREKTPNTSQQEKALLSLCRILEIEMRDDVLDEAG